MSGPLPRDRPSFPAQFLAQADRLVRSRTAAAHFRQRARLVLLLHDRPALSNVAAGRSVGLHPNAVRRWRRRWAAGQFALADRPGRGRKPTFSPPRPGPRHGPGV
jgi:hypothetical protein